MPKLTERITTAAHKTLKKLHPGIKKDGVNAIKEALEPHSPPERGELETAIRGFYNASTSKYKAEFEKVKAKHSPITPEEAASIQTVLGSASVAGLGFAAGGASLIEVLGVGQLEAPSDWLRRMVEIAGLGLVAGATIKVPYEKGIHIPYQQYYNKVFMPEIPDMRYAFDAAARYKITKTDFYELLRLHGYNPDKHLTKPIEYLGKKIETHGEMFRQLAGGPAGYFLLSMAARSGYYDRERFRQMLKDSDYSDEVSKLALKAFETSFLRRHYTKFENEAIEDYSKGDISLTELKDRLKNIGYTEDMVRVIGGFYEERKLRARKHVTLSASRAAFVAGRLSEEGFRHKLVALGYASEDIDFIVDEAKAKYLEKQGDQVESSTLTKGEIKMSYRHGVIDESQFKLKMQEKNLRDEDIQILLDTENTRKEPDIRIPSYSMIGTEYKKGVIEESEARTELSALGYAGKDVDDLIALWNVAITPSKAAVKPLTMGQLNKAYRDGILPRETYQDELREREYDETAVKLLSEMYTPEIKPPKPTHLPDLTLSQVSRCYREKIITEKEYEKELEERKYSEGDIERLKLLYAPEE